MAKTPAPVVLILGQDSLRADRALTEVLRARKADPAEVVRIWGDESSFSQVFAAANSRSLFAEQTVVVVRRAERLRGGGSAREVDDEEGGDATDERAEEPEPPVVVRGGKGKSPAPPAPDIPEFDASSTLILVARKADRRLGIWKKLSKIAETIDAEFLKGRALQMAASDEARALGLRVSEGVLRDIVDQRPVPRPDRERTRETSSLRG